jgi:hypothetical protein
MMRSLLVVDVTPPPVLGPILLFDAGLLEWQEIKVTHEDSGSQSPSKDP